ncbi:prolyl-tRNA synthetase associated domain-containing protein [Dongia soli]|uniref:Prolyl-tRNA synthetase associated domain-containing protein n=1 Tax=Dongia soli TaxID=600628 RepID=A0ABU5E7S3_9PROT|nr:prolyl-tRNA synthetase associated domain-containing protein [Dongia soli]MDY0882239.1 prolyl-tRNA synthetase associated domain-containing protein [Dongia soli]
MSESQAAAPGKDARNPQADGTEAPALPTSAEQLLARLNDLGIVSRTVDHAAVFTVDEAKNLRGELPGGHIKNLFLRNKKEEMWLVVVEEDKRVDLKTLGEQLGAGKLSFGSADRLMTYLGVLPGAVTPFSIINDKENKVRVVLDEDLLTRDPVNCHPLVNTKTTALSPADLLRFLEAEGHKPQLMRFA